MNIKDLVGFQLVGINDSCITVRKNNEQYTLDIDEDYGGCCGYNEIETKLLVTDEELERNPIITDIIFDSSDRDKSYGDSMKITFFGEVKPLATLDSFSSSGSTWMYGACVSIKCKAIDLDEVITEW